MYRYDPKCSTAFVKYLSNPSVRLVLWFDLRYMLINSKHVDLLKITKDIFTFWFVFWIWLHWRKQMEYTLAQHFVLSILHSRYHACWCAGARASLMRWRQGISRPWYSPSTKSPLAGAAWNFSVEQEGGQAGRHYWIGVIKSHTNQISSRRARVS